MTKVSSPARFSQTSTQISWSRNVDHGPAKRDSEMRGDRLRAQRIGSCPPDVSFAAIEYPRELTRRSYSRASLEQYDETMTTPLQGQS